MEAEEKELRRKTLIAILNAYPPGELERLQARLVAHGKFPAAAESLFSWIKELQSSNEIEASEELVEGLAFLAKRVNQELEKMIKDKQRGS